MASDVANERNANLAETSNSPSSELRSKNSKSASNNSNSSAVNDTSDSDDPSKVKVLKRDLSLKSNDLGSKEFSFKKRQIRVMKTILMNITFFFLAWAP